MINRILKNLHTLSLILILIIFSSIHVFAENNITYCGESQQFVFMPGKEYSPTDLFSNFKNVVPGDNLSQQIEIKNKASNKVKIDVYLRVAGAHEESTDFLSQLNLQVNSKNKNILFDAPAHETAQLTDWVNLGTFYPGADITLDVLLSVPIEMGNDYANQLGYLDWEFKVDEFPIEPGDPHALTTGDKILILMPILFLISLTILVFEIIRRKRFRILQNNINL